ncbi:hypothetical protein EJB05_57062, partial [Eragrostis curvula]
MRSPVFKAELYVLMKEAHVQQSKRDGCCGENSRLQEYQDKLPFCTESIIGNSDNFAFRIRLPSVAQHDLVLHSLLLKLSRISPSTI